MSGPQPGAEHEPLLLTRELLQSLPDQAQGPLVILIDLTAREHPYIGHVARIGISLEQRTSGPEAEGRNNRTVDAKTAPSRSTSDNDPSIAIVAVQHCK